MSNRSILCQVWSGFLIEGLDFGQDESAWVEEYRTGSGSDRMPQTAIDRMRPKILLAEVHQSIRSLPLPVLTFCCDPNSVARYWSLHVLTY